MERGIEKFCYRHTVTPDSIVIPFTHRGSTQILCEFKMPASVKHPKVSHRQPGSEEERSGTFLISVSVYLKRMVSEALLKCRFKSQENISHLGDVLKQDCFSKYFLLLNSKDCTVLE